MLFTLSMKLVLFDRDGGGKEAEELSTRAIIHVHSEKKGLAQGVGVIGLLSEAWYWLLPRILVEP